LAGFELLGVWMKVAPVIYSDRGKGSRKGWEGGKLKQAVCGAAGGLKTSADGNYSQFIVVVQGKRRRLRAWVGGKGRGGEVWKKSR